MRLIANWRNEITRLWSIRIGLMFAGLNGFLLGFAAFVTLVNPWIFLLVNLVGWTVLIGARLLKQQPEV